MKHNKILCLTSNFPRWQGDSTTPFVLNLARELQKLGWQVDVLAPHAPGCARKFFCHLRNLLRGNDILVNCSIL